MVLAEIVAQAQDDAGDETSGAAASSSSSSTSFEAVERSASEVLHDVFTRFLRMIGGAARAAAEQGGRCESNLADLCVALSEVRPDGARLSVADLRAFVEEAAEVVLPQNVPAFPVPRPPLSDVAAKAALDLATEKPPAYVPDFLPPFPEKRTYQHTETLNVRPHDSAAAKKRRVKQRREAQDSLLKLTDGGATSVAAAGDPPPLPVMQEDGGSGVATAAAAAAALGGVASALIGVPDALVPSMPAMVQSTAYLETSGYVDKPTFGAATSASSSSTAAVAGVRDALAGVTAQDHEDILKMEHMDGLDTLGKTK